MKLYARQWGDHDGWIAARLPMLRRGLALDGWQQQSVPSLAGAFWQCFAPWNSTGVPGSGGRGFPGFHMARPAHAHVSVHACAGRTPSVMPWPYIRMLTGLRARGGGRHHAGSFHTAAQPSLGLRLRQDRLLLPEDALPGRGRGRGAARKGHGSW